MINKWASVVEDESWTFEPKTETCKNGSWDESWNWEHVLRLHHCWKVCPSLL